MTDRKILLLILSVIIYCLYSAHMWFAKHGTQETISEAIKNTEETVQTESKPQNSGSQVTTNLIQTIDLDSETLSKKPTVKKKLIKLYYKNACSALQVFTEKPIANTDPKKEKSVMENNAITALGITIFLMVLVINAVLDTLKAKEEEKAKRKLNPDGERRQSLAEFANKKSLRRESSKFGLQLFQIAESMLNSEEEKKECQQKRPYTRGDSTNSYLSENKKSKTNSESPTAETSIESRLTKRQSVSKLFGCRSRSMERRSSFPALPQNPDIHAMMMMGHRQPSVDSDDEDKGRRVRIIRRF